MATDTAGRRKRGTASTHDGCKTCNACHETKPVTEFYRSKKGDGFGYRCKGCARASMKASRTPEKDREEALRRYHANPNGKARKRELYAADPERHRAYVSRWRERNVDQMPSLRRKWYASGGAEAAKLWRERNPEAAKRITQRANFKRRKVRIRGEALNYAMVLLDDACSYCGGPADTVDHIVPASAGGRSDWGNLTAACRSCNSSKKDRPLLSHLLMRVTRG